MTTRTVNCPHCGAVYRLSAQTGGSEQPTCSRCGTLLEERAITPQPPARSLAEVEQEIADLQETLEWLGTVLSFAVRVTDEDVIAIKDNLTTFRPLNRFFSRVSHPSIGQRPTTDENAYSKAIEILGSSVGSLDDIASKSFFEHLKGATDDYRRRRQIKIDTIGAAIAKLEQTLEGLASEAARLRAGESADPTLGNDASDGRQGSDGETQGSGHFKMAYNLYLRGKFAE